MRKINTKWAALLAAVTILFVPGTPAQQRFTPYPTQTLRFETPPPLLPTNVRANYSGAFGANTFVYWVIAQHTRGASGLSVPATVRNVGTLAGGNPVIISWSAVAGANTYDIIRFTSTAIVLPCAACQVATGVTGTSTSDTGAVLGAQALAPIGRAEAVYRLDNSSFTVARMVWELPPTGATFFPMVAPTTGGTGADQDIPCYSGAGTVLTPCDTGVLTYTGGSFSLVEAVNRNTVITSENTNAVGTASAGVLRTVASTAELNSIAHGAGRVISRWGVTLGNWAELLQVAGDGFAIGSLGADPLILGTSALNRLEISATGDVGVTTGSLTYTNSANVASVAGTMVLPAGNVFHITGANAITAMDTCDAANNGRQVKLIFDAILTFTDGNNLVIAGNFVTTADDSIKLTCDGTNWNEDGRSVN